MLREQHEEQNNTDNARNNHEQGIPVDVDAFFPPFHDKEDNPDNQHHTEILYGGDGKFFFDDLYTRRNCYATFLDQRTVDTILIDLGTVEIVHEVMGQKFLLAEGGGLVCLDAQ